MNNCADGVARCVISAFGALPPNAKPRRRQGESSEWVPLSGIVLLDEETGNLRCVSLATGMKCLPRDQISLAKGNTLHDSHAEVLALRAFNRFLLEECIRLLNGAPNDSPIVQWKRSSEPTGLEHSPPFEIRNSTQIIMYSSEAPCGDASMELIMEQQGDSTPWAPAVEKDPESSASEQTLLGRGYFSQLGVVRRKPGRTDAPETLSKSCSDKLALKQCSSILNAVASLFIDPSSAYIHTLVVPESQYRPTACSRAFGPEGRLQPLVGDNLGGYGFRPFRIETTDHEFEWSRRSIPSEYRVTACNTAMVATPTFREVTVGGTLQGRKQFDPRGASRLSRRNMWATAKTLALLLGDPEISQAMEGATYGDVKSSELLRKRRNALSVVKSKALVGWVPNSGDEDFTFSAY